MILTTVSTPCQLSKREIEVLTLWLVTETKREVAERLFISEATVHTHINRIRDKYAAANRPARTKVALLVRATEDGHCTIGEVRRAINRSVSALPELWSVAS